MENVRRVKALITVISGPGKTLDSRIVRWRIAQRLPDGKIQPGKQGAITVAVPKHLVGTAADQVAELGALHDLLVNREVLGQGRGGNGLIIQVSHGAIRKLVLWYKQVCSLPIAVRKASLGQKSRGLSLAEMDGEVGNGDVPQFGSAYLTPYGRFLFGRFADAEIVISKDIKWIDVVVPEKLQSEIVLGRSLPDIIYATEQLGYVEIRTHAVERVAMRFNAMGYQQAWRFIVNQLTSNSLRLVTEEYARTHKLKSKYINGDRWHNPIENWIFVLAKENGLHLLVTMMVAEKEI